MKSQKVNYRKYCLLQFSFRSWWKWYSDFFGETGNYIRWLCVRVKFHKKAIIKKRCMQCVNKEYARQNWITVSHTIYEGSISRKYFPLINIAIVCIRRLHSFLPCSRKINVVFVLSSQCTQLHISQFLFGFPCFCSMFSCPYSILQLCDRMT